jgi:hypothetical protein
MPANTPNTDLPYPLPADPIDTAGDIQRLAEAVDVAFGEANDGNWPSARVLWIDLTAGPLVAWVPQIIGSHALDAVAPNGAYDPLPHYYSLTLTGQFTCATADIKAQIRFYVAGRLGFDTQVVRAETSAYFSVTALVAAQTLGEAVSIEVTNIGSADLALTTGAGSQCYVVRLQSR